MRPLVIPNNNNNNINKNNNNNNMYTQGLDHAALGLLHTLDGLGVDGDVAGLGASEAHLIMKIIKAKFMLDQISF